MVAVITANALPSLLPIYICYIDICKDAAGACELLIGGSWGWCLEPELSIVDLGFKVGHIHLWSPASLLP